MHINFTPILRVVIVKVVPILQTIDIETNYAEIASKKAVLPMETWYPSL